MLIAIREFEQAVSLISTSQSISSVKLSKADHGTGKDALNEIEDADLSAEFGSKIDERSSNLANALLQDLGRANGKTSVSRIVSWLSRLGEGDKARETFLASRADLVKQRVKQIGYEGDIPVYIGELAMVNFALIKNTCEWYMAAFKDNKLSSSMSLLFF